VYIIESTRDRNGCDDVIVDFYYWSPGRGMDILRVDRMGAGLSWAAGNGCDSAVEMLMEVGGADVNAADSSRRTAVCSGRRNRRAGLLWKANY